MFRTAIEGGGGEFLSCMNFIFVQISPMHENES